jgi:hypothetical protein
VAIETGKESRARRDLALFIFRPTASCLSACRRFRRGGFCHRLLHAAGEIAFGNLDGLEHRFDFRAALLEPRRKEQALAELVGGLIYRKSRGHRRGALHQNAAGTTAIDRMEVHTVFYFRGVRVAELFVDTLLLGQLFVTFNFECHVMRRTGAEDPAS